MRNESTISKWASPGFLTLGPSPVCFPMTVPGRDPRDEVRQFVLSPSRAQDDAPFPVEGERHAISFPEAGLFGDRERDPDRQAVPPFRNRGFISHMYLL